MRYEINLTFNGTLSHILKYKLKKITMFRIILYDLES